jgi:hypothetical protein
MRHYTWPGIHRLGPADEFIAPNQALRAAQEHRLLFGMQVGGSAQPLGWAESCAPQGLTTQVKPAAHAPFGPQAGNSTLGKNEQLKSATPRAQSGAPPGKVLKHWQVPWKQAGAGRAAVPQKYEVPLPQVRNWLAAPVQAQLPAPPVQVLFVQVWPPVQTAQVWPPVPQACTLSPGWQMPFRQQPCGQVVASQVTQVPFWQLWLGPQVMQTPPLEPQAAVVLPGKQPPPFWQQPLGQLWGEHVL